MDLLDLGGTRQGKQLEKLAKDPHRVMANCRFLGRVEVPLSETLSQRRGLQQPAATFLLTTPFWLALGSPLYLTHLCDALHGSSIL